MRVSEMAPTPVSYHSGSLISQFLFSENQRSGSSIFGGEWKSITSILPPKRIMMKELSEMHSSLLVLS